MGKAMVDVFGKGAHDVPKRGHDAVLTEEAPSRPPQEKTARFWTLTFGSVGVVYGDIGTSPLYAMREALHHAGADGLTRPEVIGVASLLLWALILIVTLKYVLFLLRADNRGEGGILSLFALAQSAIGGRTALLFILGMAGAALFYGDAVLTPAISVLSAVEGVKLVAPGLGHYVVPITIAILIALFAVQSRGTEAVAAWFGPIMTLWFLTIAAAGALHVSDDPAILGAFDPRHAAAFLVQHGAIGFVVLGAVFLAVTGAEALYADMGHFGRRPIQTAWIFLVFPALATNYLGQGAFVLANPAALENPFFMMVPGWALIPLVALATAATIIASQAVITGAYSLSRQAIQLGFLPRLEIRHTSESLAGQIYMPKINLYLLAGVLGLVLFFQSSSGLATAYGIAVSGTMVVTTALALVVMRYSWHWPLWLAALVALPIAAIEAVFLLANLLKFTTGGYVPALIALFLFLVMWTWAVGTRSLQDKTRKSSVSLGELIEMLRKSPPPSTPGTAVFLTSDTSIAPMALMHNLKHNRVLHERNIVLAVRSADVPRIADENRIRIDRLDRLFTKIEVTFGYMESPDLMRALALCRRQDMTFDIMSTSFFLGRRKIIADPVSGMPWWQDRLYIGLTETAANPTDYYHLPPGRVVELGQQIAL